MTALSGAGGESLLAHGIHYTLLVGGVGGLGVLLLPQLFSRSGLLAPVAPRNDLERRIELLRTNLAEGSLSTGPPAATLVRRAPTPAPEPTESPADSHTSLLLPLAVVSSLAAAGVHAAVGPAHFAEGTLIGLFFAFAALLQLAWVALVVLGTGPRLLLAGVVGNLSLVALWAATRTVGFPGVLPGPEEVGPWDVACGLWELTVAAACLTLLGRGTRVRLEGWPGWHPAARGWFVGSVLLLALLSASGARA